MPHAYTEDQLVEQPAIGLFAELGWTTVSAAEETFGAKVIDRLALDLQRAFPGQQGFSPRNLKYMRAFAEAWPETKIVQQPAAQLTEARKPESAIVQAPLAQSSATMSPIVQAPLAQLPWYHHLALMDKLNSPEMNFYLSAVDDCFRQTGDQPSIGLILCRTKNRVIAEYALRDMTKPIGVAGYLTKLVDSLPKALKGAVPSVAELEKGLTSKRP